MLLHSKNLWFQRRRFLKFLQNKSIKAIDPQNVDSFDPKGLIGRVYIGTTRHYYILKI